MTLTLESTPRYTIGAPRPLAGSLAVMCSEPAFFCPLFCPPNFDQFADWGLTVYVQLGYNVYIHIQLISSHEETKMTTKLVAKIREPKARNADWILARTDEIFEGSGYSDDFGKPVFVSKNVFYTDATCASVDYETDWRRAGHSQTVQMLSRHFGLTAEEISKILS